MYAKIIADLAGKRKPVLDEGGGVWYNEAMENSKVSRESAVILARKARWMIRVIWLLTALAWIGLWLLNAMEEQASMLLLLVLMLMHVGGCILLGRVYTRLIQEREEAEALREMLASADAINVDLRAKRHDVINHLQVVYSLLQLGDQEEALAYLTRINQDFVSARAVLRTNDSAVNALLQAKMIQGEQRGLKMEMEIRTGLEDLPLESWEFCRILGNLLDNAMDAAEEAEEGFVKLHLWMDLEGVRFSVTNNGASVPEELRERIFQPGFSTKGDRGTGMGLYIVKTLVERTGGEIRVSSDAGQTTFIGCLRVKTPALDAAD